MSDESKRDEVERKAFLYDAEQAVLKVVDKRLAEARKRDVIVAAVIGAFLVFLGFEAYSDASDMVADHLQPVVDESRQKIERETEALLANIETIEEDVRELQQNVSKVISREMTDVVSELDADAARVVEAAISNRERIADASSRVDALEIELSREERRLRRLVSSKVALRSSGSDARRGRPSDREAHRDLGITSLRDGLGRGAMELETLGLDLEAAAEVLFETCGIGHGVSGQDRSRECVSELQQQYGLMPDGRIGPATGILIAALATREDPEVPYRVRRALEGEYTHYRYRTQTSRDFRQLRDIARSPSHPLQEEMQIVLDAVKVR